MVVQYLSSRADDQGGQRTVRCKKGGARLQSQKRRKLLHLNSDNWRVGTFLKSLFECRYSLLRDDGKASKERKRG